MRTVSRRNVLMGASSVTLLPKLGQADEPVVKIVYPFPAGGSGDAIARVFADQLHQRLGKSIIVENKSGAAGRIGAQAVKVAPADGSVLLFASAAQLTLQPHLFRDLGYDPFKDYLPLSQVVTFDVALAVGSASSVRSISELAAWYRVNPSQAVYGSPGTGTASHFAAMEFARKFDLDLRHVVYRGTPAALPDLLSGRIPAYIAATPELIEHHRSGRIRVLATVGARRSSLLLGISTFAESGVNIDATGWFAFYVPARTPPDVAKRLENEIVSIANLPEIRARILALGFQATATSSDELREIQHAEFDRWASIVKLSGFTAER